MALDWVYPVNDTSGSWGYEASVLEFFAGDRSAGRHHWHLSSIRHELAPGDRIWVRAAAPIGAFVGLGRVVTRPKAVGDYYRFGVEWDDAVCAELAEHPVHVELDSVPQSPRTLKAPELERLSAVYQEPTDDELAEGKRRQMRSVSIRQGQPAFRAALLRAYDGRCAITGCAVPAVLQAAHIDPYDGPSTNSLKNGLLLRSDVHDLFDTWQLWITESGVVAIAESLTDSEYDALAGTVLRLPDSPRNAPSRRRLASHRKRCGAES